MLNNFVLGSGVFLIALGSATLLHLGSIAALLVTSGVMLVASSVIAIAVDRHGRH